MAYSLTISSVKAMLQLGRRLAHACEESKIQKCVIYLEGELGAGKTTLVRGFLRGLGFKKAVKSPTYTIVEPYSIGKKNKKIIYHFDLYRLTNVEELAYIGARDYFGENAICLIEWPKNGIGFLPQADLVCSIAFDEVCVSARKVVCEGVSEVGKKLVEVLASNNE